MKMFLAVIILMLGSSVSDARSPVQNGYKRPNYNYGYRYTFYRYPYYGAYPRILPYYGQYYSYIYGYPYNNSLYYPYMY